MILKRAWIVLIIFITPDSWKSKIFKIVLKKIGMDTSLFALGQLYQGRPVISEPILSEKFHKSFNPKKGGGAEL